MHKILIDKTIAKLLQQTKALVTWYSDLHVIAVDRLGYLVASCLKTASNRYALHLEGNENRIHTSDGQLNSASPGPASDCSSKLLSYSWKSVYQPIPILSSLYFLQTNIGVWYCLSNTIYHRLTKVFNYQQLILTYISADLCPIFVTCIIFVLENLANRLCHLYDFYTVKIIVP